MPGVKYKPNEIDFYIGKLITNMRNKMGLSQKDIAKRLGVSFQQVQKYETGDNRISASRLYSIAQAMEVPISAIFNEVANQQIYDQQLQEMINILYNMPIDDRTVVYNLIKRLS